MCLFFESCTRCGKHHHQTRCSCVKLQLFERKSKDEKQLLNEIFEHRLCLMFEKVCIIVEFSLGFGKYPTKSVSKIFCTSSIFQGIFSCFSGDWNTYDGTSRLGIFSHFFLICPSISSKRKKLIFPMVYAVCFVQHEQFSQKFPRFRC